ncbi:MAG TPA: copper homeostasis protein CutC [Candidatus Eisenbacteria bacterium]|jgi:copper homeostasis protein|nr:copper homeostasis protein CutC [Candidatus Eisenbacteria bacterium]
MKKRALLEMSVESLDAALAAVRGGADRIELCENLSVGGVTPNAELLRQARELIQAPIFVMIRPRGGNFCYSAQELQQMKQETAMAKAAGMDGVVFGILTDSGLVDTHANATLVDLAKPLSVTFHRAFDELQDLEQGLEQVIATGATRILTSGGRPRAEDGSAQIARLIRQAGDRILILPGGGIRPGNLERVARQTQAREFHSGLSNMLSGPHRTHHEFEEGVRMLIHVLEAESRSGNPSKLQIRMARLSNGRHR